MLGNPGVGKSSYIRRLGSAVPHDVYVPTKNPEKISHVFRTEKGVNNILTFHDMPIIYPQTIKRDTIQADAAIIMFKPNDGMNYQTVGRWREAVLKEIPNLVSITVANKFENAQINPQVPAFNALQPGIPIFQISVKTLYRYLDPVKYIIDKLNYQDVGAVYYSHTL